jgi:hypothetical protein
MLVRVELERRGEARLYRVDFVGISGQVCGSRFEVHEQEVEVFPQRAEAEARLADLTKERTAA